MEKNLINVRVKISHNSLFRILGLAQQTRSPESERWKFRYSVRVVFGNVLLDGNSVA